MKIYEQLIERCYDCPNYNIDEECLILGDKIEEPLEIPNDCPLDDC